MKRRISLLLAVVMVLGSFSFAFAANDVDVPEFLKGEKIFVGDKDGDLMLNKNLTREEAVVLLARLLKVEEEAEKYEVTEKLPSFKDTKDIDPYWRPFIAWAEDNEYFKGHEGKREGEFGFGDNLTAKQYAIVLLRALGYEEAEDWKKAFAKAEELGLLKDVKADEDNEIVRKTAAQMTYNALGTEMADGKGTLAKKLGIKMPEDKPEKLEAEVYTENLKEVVVELNDASLADKAKLEDVRNYRLTGSTFKVEKAELKDNKVILLIANELDKDDNVVYTQLVDGKTYSLLIRNIDKDINKTYRFTAKDNTIPAVEKVESLGEYGIKVTTTEPVKDARERNFLIDGRNVAMVVEQYGREIILTPYHKQAFPEDAKTLTVKELKDYSGFRSASEDINFEMIKDEEGPEVVSAVSTGKDVIVTFDKDVYIKSISKYWGIKAPGNISYIEGRHPIYAIGAKKVDTNKVVYTFKEELPRRAQVTIEDVQNHSKVAMEKVTVDVVEIIDYTEPEIINKVVWDTTADGKGKSEAILRLYFDKDVTGSFEKGKEGKEFDASKHFTIYQREVLTRNIVKDANITATYLGNRKDAIQLVITGLSQNNLDGDYDYILEIADFRDINSERNRMYRDYMDFDIWPGDDPFNVLDVTVVDKGSKHEITILFDKAVDRVIAEDPTNYIFEASWGKLDVKDLGGDIITERNGKEVTLVIPSFNNYGFDKLRILDVLKDKDGVRLTKTYTYVFGEIFEGLVKKAEKLETEAAKYTGVEAVDNAKNELLKLKDSETGYKKADHSKLVAAMDKLEKAIKDADKAEGKKLEEAKENLKNKIAEAEKAYKENGNADLAKAIVDAKAVLADEKATLKEVNDAIEKLNNAIEGAKVDKTALKAAIADAEKALLEEDKYTKETVDALKVALAEATKVLNNKDATKAQVDAATTNLTKAVKALEEKEDEEKITAEAQIIENALVRKFLVTVRLSDETKNTEVTGFKIDGKNYEVKRITTDGRVQADCALDKVPTEVIVIVGDSEIKAEIIIK